MFVYSDNLIQEITAIFKTDYGVDLTRDQAVEYLDSLADLYDCLEVSVRQGFGSEAGGGGVPPKAAVAPDPLT